MFWSAECSLLRAEGVFCSLDFLYGGLGIGKLQFFILKKYLTFFQLQFFFNFKSSKRIGIQPKMLDPDQMDTDPKNCPHHSPTKSWMMTLILSRCEWRRVRRGGGCALLLGHVPPDVHPYYPLSHDDDPRTEQEWVKDGTERRRVCTTPGPCSTWCSPS